MAIILNIFAVYDYYQLLRAGRT